MFKGHLTFDTSDKYIRALFYVDTTSSRMHITYNNKTMVHNSVPKAIQKEIKKIGGKIEMVYNIGKRAKSSFYGIPIKLVNIKKNSTIISVEVTGSNSYEVVDKLKKIKNTLETWDVKITECTYSGENDFLGIKPSVIYL